MTEFITVDNIIKRLQDIMAENNPDLKKAIGGAVDLPTILDNTSMCPMSFHVAYTGCSIEEQNVLSGEPSASVKDNYGIFVVLNMDKFNGRKPQSLVPKIRSQLIYALWGWEWSSEYQPFEFDGDDTEYIDRGRYIHSFEFSTSVRIDGNDKYQEGNPTPFDSLYSEWIMGEDDNGNTISKDLDIINIYNEGAPLEV